MTSRRGLSRYTYPAHVPWGVLSRTRGGTLTVRFLPSSCTKGGLVATASKLAAATFQTAELFALLYPRNGGMCEFLRRAQACLAGTPPGLHACSDPKNFLGSGRARRDVWVRTQPTHFQSYIFPPQSHISLDPIFQGGVLGQALVGRGGELSSGAPRFQTSALRLSRLLASRYSNAAKISQQNPPQIDKVVRCHNTKQISTEYQPKLHHQQRNILATKDPQNNRIFEGFSDF